MELTDLLRDVELFDGLDDSEIEQVARICEERLLEKGEVLATQGKAGDELFIVTEGFLEVLLEDSPSSQAKVVVNLGTGQIIGEMALIDQGPRSATVRSIEDHTVVQAINRANFNELCETNNHIGYIVMRNVAADLSFKLRHRNLSERG